MVKVGRVYEGGERSCGEEMEKVNGRGKRDFINISEGYGYAFMVSSKCHPLVTSLVNFISDLLHASTHRVRTRRFRLMGSARRQPFYESS